MSYERMYDRIERAVCACGMGEVIHHTYEDMNDWNQTRSGIYGEEILCPACKGKYHIEHITRTFPQPKWDGDGIVTTYYLVPIGKTVNLQTKPRPHSFTFDQACVAKYTKEELSNVVSDMKESRYSTRLALDDSKKIVSAYERRYKKRGLPQIIAVLEKCIQNYSGYNLTHDSFAELQEMEQARITENQKIIDAVLKESFQLNFKEDKE